MLVYYNYILQKNNKIIEKNEVALHFCKSLLFGIIEDKYILLSTSDLNVLQYSIWWKGKKPGSSQVCSWEM